MIEPTSTFFSSYPKILCLLERNSEHKFTSTIRMPEVLAVKSWDFYRKYDGTNVRIGYMPPNETCPDGEVLIGGRTAKTLHVAPLVEYLQSVFTLDAFKAIFPEMKAPVTLYGEGVGAKIQGGFEGDEYGLRLFDVRVGRCWQPIDFTGFIAHKFNIPWMERLIVDADLENMLTLSEEDFEGIEGFIARPHNAILLNSAGERVMFKWTHGHHKAGECYLQEFIDKYI